MYLYLINQFDNEFTSTGKMANLTFFHSVTMWHVLNTADTVNTVKTHNNVCCVFSEVGIAVDTE